MKKITWLGHAAFKIEIDGLTIFVDPWIKGNPVSPLKSYKEIKKADLVLVTHDHNDHGFKDALKICKKTGATFVSVFELANKARRKFVKKTIGSNIGAEISVNDTKIYFTPAWHSSNVASPCGFIVKTPNLTFYHTGDTAFYSDMELFSKLYEIDLMLVPLCPTYMMGIKETVWAVEKVKPKITIPMHYNTFSKIKADPQEFKKMVADKSKVEIVEINQILEL